MPLSRSVVVLQPSLTDTDAGTRTGTGPGTGTGTGPGNRYRTGPGAVPVYRVPIV